MATVGISVEQSVVRGVVLAAGPPGVVLRSIQRRLRGGAVGAAISGVLDGVAEELGDETGVEDVAIVYRSVAERRAIVSQLAAGKWASSSLVSDRSALAVLAREERGLDEFGTVLMLELVDGQISFVIVGPARDAVSAADSWTSGTVDADSAGHMIGRILPILESVDVDAVAVCGSGAGDPDIAPVLQLGFEAPVIVVPDHADGAARGAALIAAERLRELPVAVPSNGRRKRRLLLGAAAVATVLGASGIAVAQILDDPSSEAIGRAAESLLPSTPAAAIPSAPITIESAPRTTPIAIEPPPQQISPIAPTRPPARRTPPATASAPTTRTTEPGAAPATETTPGSAPLTEPGSTTTEAPTSTAPTPTTVGAPDGNWLFPGESPPPPLNADPEVVRAWWANHWMLKERWLRGG
ncbi:hypothetical protein OIE68_26210 [Nocardia vinacea]|uniref:hypothetical protein n=1 Tax=Nocardia vinacea TaxID=96468 RepID=UPI002E0D5D1F|nr:hypothetical protein OIE68_26210 [Nocardia vinacea]